MKNDGLAGNNVEIQTTRETFAVDGFVFDGPANRPEGSTNRLDSATVTTIATTTAATNDAQYNQCVTRCPVSHENFRFRSFSSFLSFIVEKLFKNDRRSRLFFIIIPVLCIF